jgi:hypothetical protein
MVYFANNQSIYLRDTTTGTQHETWRLYIFLFLVRDDLAVSFWGGVPINLGYTDYCTNANAIDL